MPSRSRRPPPPGFRGCSREIAGLKDDWKQTTLTNPLFPKYNPSMGHGLRAFRIVSHFAIGYMFIRIIYLRWKA